MKRPHTMLGAFRRLRYHTTILRMRILDAIDPVILGESAMLLFLLFLCVLAFGCTPRASQTEQSLERISVAVARTIEQIPGDPTNQRIHVDGFWRVVENEWIHADVYLLRDTRRDRVHRTNCMLVMITHAKYEARDVNPVLLDNDAPCGYSPQ